MDKTEIRVGPTKYCSGESFLTFTHYMETGGIAVGLIDAETYEPNLTASVNLESYGAPKVADDEFWLKEYSENEGVREALVEAGVIEIVPDRFHPSGYVVLPLARLIGEAREAALAHLKKFEKAPAPA